MRREIKEARRVDWETVWKIARRLGGSAGGVTFVALVLVSHYNWIGITGVAMFMGIVALVVTFVTMAIVESVRAYL